MSAVITCLIHMSQKCLGCTKDTDAENALLRAEVVRLSGKTGYCMLCEGYAKEISRLKAVYEAAEALMAKMGSKEFPVMSAYEASFIQLDYELAQYVNAKQALSPQEGGEK